MGKGRIFYEYGYFLKKATSLPFDGIFTKEIEENVRVNGGVCPKNNISREDVADIPDMETLVDMRRRIRIFSPLIEEGIMRKNGTNRCWDDFHPAPQDLVPFHAIMASVDDDLAHPSFSSPLSGRAHVKITYHRGGRVVSPKKEAFT